MKILVLAAAFFLALSAGAQEIFGVSVNAGADLVTTENVLYPVIGEYRGVRSNYGVTPCYRLGVMPELRFKRFHIASGVNFMLVPYSEVVHRYMIYYSPAGNPYGGNIYNEYKGKYLMAELAVRMEKMFYSSEKINLGFTAGGAIGKELSHEYHYSAFSAGVTVAKQFGPVELALRPQALFFPSQKINYFSPFAARIEFSVRFQTHNGPVSE